MTTRVITVLIETFSLNSSKKTAKYRNNCFTLHILEKNKNPAKTQTKHMNKQTNKSVLH